MKLFVVVIVEDSLLWKQFLDYYRKIGVKEFFVIKPSDIRIKEEDDVHVFVNNKAYEAEHSNQLCKISLIKEKCSPCEWYISADADEFIEFDKPLNKIVKEAESENCNAVRGVLWDRVAKNGQLLPTSENIWKQYPVICEFSKVVLGAYLYKLVLIKGHLKFCNNLFHYAYDQKLFSREMIIHHFKWREGILERLKERFEYQVKNNISWANEHKIFIDYWNKNKKIDWKHVLKSNKGNC